MPPTDAQKTIHDLIAIMAALRTPVTGCPWDLEQDFKTIAPYTIEEAYEVADAIERAEMADLKEELGDLLLQVVYHARMAEEQQAFDFAGVVDGICRKMVRRHPHVFGDEAARSAGVAKGFWERIKAEEKADRDAERRRLRLNAAGTSAQPDAIEPGPSVLADVPSALPALTRAVKLQAKAARVGFGWPDLKPVFAKLREELHELEASIQDREPQSRIAEELGDLLFVVANVARHLDADPEDALRSANRKFTKRFHYIEARLAASGRTPMQSDLTEMDKLWDEAKARKIR